MKFLRFSILAILMILPTPTRAQLYSIGSEEATLIPPWNFIWVVGNPTINANLTYVHSGAQSMQLYYVIAGGGGHLDLNRYISKTFDSGGYPDGIDHFFIRGYVYVKTPEAGGSKDIQRKLLYLRSFVDLPDYPSHRWHAVVKTFTTAGTGHLMNICIDAGTDVIGAPTVNHYPDPPVYLNFDQWYCIEAEIKANTPGIADGEERLWVDGIKVVEVTGITFRAAGYARGIQKMQVGDQADTVNLAVDEYRYWDDVVISASYIGT